MTTLITGASSGIGEALAIECAKRGDALFLCARNHERLENVTQKCREEGSPFVYAETIDVSEETLTRAWLEKCESIRRIDRVFSNAGIGTGQEDEKNVRRTWAVNVNGNLNVVLPMIEIFRRREKAHNEVRGQILITSSIAGYGPISSCPAYAGTKSAMKTWGLSLRGMLKKERILVSVICPGFVRSRITDLNTCPMPFFMEADKAAKIILKKAEKNIGLIAFPWPMRLATYVLSIMPFAVNELFNSLLPKKISTRS